MLRLTRKKLAAVVLMTAALMGIGATAAQANSVFSTTSNVSWYFWHYGSNVYTQSHNGDDFAMDVTSGIDIYAGWCKSDKTVCGSAYHVQGAGQPYVTLGTNFKATSRLIVAYAAYYPKDDGGTFGSWQYWNYSWT